MQMKPENEPNPVTNLSQTELISTNQILDDQKQDIQEDSVQEHSGQINNEQPYSGQADSQDLPGQVLTFRVSSQARPKSDIETDLKFETFS